MDLNERTGRAHRDASSHQFTRSSLLTAEDGWFGLKWQLSAFARNEEIFGEGEPSTSLYKLVSGYVRTFRMLNDGRRQIEAFYIPGDVFGLTLDDTNHVTAQAITRCKIELVSKRSVELFAVTEISVVRYLLALTGLELWRSNDHSRQLLKSAQERIVDFLIDMNERQGSNHEVELPMTRGDIADYLGLTTETVSRMLWRLENISAIAIPKRQRVIVLNLGVLQSFCK